MTLRFLTLTLNICLTGLIFMLSGMAAHAQDGVVIEYGNTAAAQTAAQIQAYWTPERMASAQPASANTLVLSTDPQAAPTPMPPADTVMLPGWNPNSGLPQPTYADIVVTRNEAVTQNLAQPQTTSYGTPPSNPKDGPYGPFQRRSLMGKYVNFPRSIIGKLFFTKPGGGNFVCSGTVTSRNTITTAGHCNSDGAGTLYGSRLFCPSYNAGGINPNIGCWSIVASATSAAYHNGRDFDYDYACLVGATSGTVISNKIGNVTGWAAHLWNSGHQLSVMAHGYPQTAPFNGNNIVQVNGPMWYTNDAMPGGQISNVMGNDMTGGSSGGGWFVSWNHPSVEAADTDNSVATDPWGAGGTPLIIGVNSYKRCVGGCNPTPTTTTGVFWQEMASPPFRDTAAASEEKDVFDTCVNTLGGGL